jgi:hypothetical protein
MSDGIRFGFWEGWAAVAAFGGFVADWFAEAIIGFVRYCLGAMNGDAHD